MRRKSGFTVIELIIVLAVLTILTTISIPGIVGWLPNYRLKSAANDLYSNFQWARLNAVKENRDWAFVFDPANNRYLVCSDSGDGDWSTTGDNDTKKTVNLPTYNSGVQFGHGSATTNATAGGGSFPGDEIDYTDNIVVFSSRGTSDAGFIYLENKLNTVSYAVGTQASGVILLRKWADTAWR